MFVCLFVLGFFVPLENFHSYGDVTIAGEGLQSLTYARHQQPLSSEGSLACHVYCDTGHPFWSCPRTRDTHTHCRAYGNGDVTTCLYDLGLSRLEFENSTFRLRGERSNQPRHRRGGKIWTATWFHCILKNYLLVSTYKRFWSSIKTKPLLGFFSCLP